MRLRTVAILRALEPAHTVETAERCWAAGMDLVEVPLQDARGWTSLEAVALCSAGRPFGAGTVLTPENAIRAVELGASVVISPSISSAVVEATLAADAVPLPGVMTPTDVAEAALLAVGTCKLFPATVVGPGWLRALRGPFPAMRFVAVGGIDVRNAPDFLRAGASGVGFGTSVAEILELDDPAGFVTSLHELAA